MKEINNEVLSEFCDRLVGEMNGFNSDEVFNNNNPLNIPFWLSVLYERLCGDISELNGFIEDLRKWSDYAIYIRKGIESDYYDSDGECIVEIDLYKVFEYDDDYDDCPDYNYEIRFSYDERYIACCQCTPQDKGYREDKDCCGESCDWDAPKFSLHKIINVASHDYSGLQKDYWDFEKDFYESRKELSEKKASEERELEIEELTSQLNDIAERIEKLTKQIEL